MARRLCGLAAALSAAAVASAAGDGSLAAAEQLARGLLEAGVGQVVQLEAGAARRLLEAPFAFGVEATAGDPVVMMHGMGDFATNPMGMVPLKNLIAKEASAYVHSVEICSSPTQLQGCADQDQSNGFLMTMDDQVDQFARVVRADPQLASGFNAVGFSQGNTIIRGYIHRYNSPPVKSFLSMHGVMMGVASIPQCPLNFPGIGLLCKTVDAIASLGIYTSFVQNHLAQANYFRDPEDMSGYLSGAHFLPYINNEVKGKENATYTANFKSLQKLVLVMADGDTMVHPKESEQFGFFKDGSLSELVAMKDAPWYIEDWFGLRSLDEAGRIATFSTPGNHLRFTEEFLTQMVKQFFAPQSLLV